MVEPGLEDLFPGLRGQPYQIQSPRDGNYNCIAWAVGDSRNIPTGPVGDSGCA